MHQRKLSFALLLPFVSFLLAFTTLAVFTTMGYMNLRGASRNGSAVRIGVGKYSMVVPRDHFFHQSLWGAAFVCSKLIQALDLPGFSMEIAVDRATGAWPMTWTPPGMDFLTWRAFMFPIYSLPFWWFAGFGLEGLAGRRFLRWPVLLLGSLLCGFFVFLLCGLTFGLSPEDRTGIVYPFWGFGLWCVLLVIFPVTWFVQWRRKKKLKPSRNETSGQAGGPPVSPMERTT